jgi:transposase
MMEIKLYGQRIMICRQAIDFRKGISGLIQIIKELLKGDASKSIYIFYNRAKTGIKILTFHRNGFLLVYKKMASGSFEMKFNKAEGTMEINNQELSWMLAGLEWSKMRHWKELNYDKFS